MKYCFKKKKSILYAWQNLVGGERKIFTRIYGTLDKCWSKMSKLVSHFDRPSRIIDLRSNLVREYSLLPFSAAYTRE